jgi:hypothetical protein
MLKALIIQKIYGLSDPELEISLCDRISFRNFLGWSPILYKAHNNGYFRESINKIWSYGRYGLIFNEYDSII